MKLHTFPTLRMAAVVLALANTTAFASQGASADSLTLDSAVGAMSLSDEVEVFNANFLNLGDVAPGPFGLGDEPSTDATRVRLDFFEPKLTPGGESAGVNESEDSVLDLYQRATLLAGGDTAALMFFRSPTLTSGGLGYSGEGLWYDNATGVQSLPEPTTALFGLALVGFCAAARRRAETKA